MKGFKYDKFKEELNNGDSWGSYSDLFMVLSFVFLMMYVVASLRSGTSSIQQRLKNQEIAKQNDDLRAQMKAYDTLKDQALKKESDEEQEVYEELMDKLTLLQEEAKDEKNKLRKQALENEKKEMALNRYQQIVRNIINANLLAKNKLKVREEIIANKNEVIGDLNEEIETKKNEIARNTEEIQKINTDLEKNIEKLKKAQQTSKMTKEKAYKEIAALKKKSEQQIAKLNEENAEVQQELSKINQELAQSQTENQELSQELTKTVSQYEGQIAQLQKEHDDKLARERGALEKKLKNAKMSALEKANQLAAFNKAAQEQQKVLSGKIASLQGEMNDVKAKADREIAGLKDDLSAAQEKANARAKLAKEIAQALKSAGVDANVNAQTGDVMISFGEDYFDAGSAKLKPTMAQVLEKFIPKYSESLFKDPKIADKISSVDIVGFASPTYKGKYVDPQSLNPDDKSAVKYNLDLSYKRASSIFDYMFDTKKIQYKNQKQLLSLVKVTGRSFFAEGRAPAGVTPGMSQKEFCKKVDCNQAQKVIIKFNLDDKK